MSKIKRDYRKKTLREEAASLDVDLDESRLSTKETRKLFQRGNLALANNDYPRAAKCFFKAWEADSDNLYLLTVVSHLLSKLGHQAVAIEFLEKAIALHGVTEDICKVMGEMALSLEMYDIAEKIYGHAVQFNPSEERYYINIASALEGQGKADDAIAFMEEVVKILNQSSDCWCMLGTLQKRNYDISGAHESFVKSLALDPESLVARNNFTGILEFTEQAREVAERTVALYPDESEPHIQLSTILLNKGILDKAWEHYEYRNDPSRGPAQTVQYTHGIDIWNGQPLAGKSIFLTSEQGLGDELYFSLGFKHLIDAGAEIHVGCDERLVHIYERSFLGLKAYAHKDIIKNNIRYRMYPIFESAKNAKTINVDYALPIGSIPLHFWDDISKIPNFESGYLRADVETRNFWVKRLESMGERPKIGLSWRSGHLDIIRDRQYIGLENLLPLISAVDADFICLQYDCKDEEIQMVFDETGKKLHRWTDVDLKQDINANLAIMESLDIVIGPAIATQMMALASSAETWLTVWGRPWWNFGQDQLIYSIPQDKKSRFWERSVNVTWNDVVANMIESLKNRWAVK